MFHHALSVSLVTTLVAVAPVMAQIPRNATVSGTTTRTVVVTHLMVGNPMVGSADRQVAVAVGAKLRENIAKVAKKEDWNVFTREKMNADLVGWGFSPDEIISASRMRSFATSTSAQVYMTSELEQGADRLWTLTTRLTGVTYPAGHTFRVKQAPGTLAQDMGAKMAEAIKPALAAYAEAKQCYDQSLDAKKRDEVVKSAYKKFPGFGMVTRCLADIEAAKDSTSDATIAKMREVLVSDSLSIDTYHRIARAHFARYQRNNSETEKQKVVETYQEMLRVAPTDQLLLEQAVVVFREFGHPDAAEQVATKMLEVDPASLKGLELRANACLGRDSAEGYQCAVEALEQYYDIDSAQATDVNFFNKITYAAKNIPDTTLLEKWANRGVAAFPNDVEMNKMQGYARLWRGDMDGAMASFSAIAALDSNLDGETKTLAKVVLNNHLEAQRTAKVFEVIPQVRKVEGQDDLVGELNTLVITRINDLWQAGQADSTKADPNQLIDLADGYLGMNPERTSANGKQFFALANMFRGFSTLPALQVAGAKAEASKSCADWASAKTVLDKVWQSLTDAKGVLGEQTDASLNTTLTSLNPFKEYLGVMFANPSTPNGCTP